METITEFTARDMINHLTCGLLIVDPEPKLIITRHPALKRRPTNKCLANLYAELLIRPFRLAGQTQFRFFNYEPLF